MADLEDVDPDDVSIPDDESGDVTPADPDAQAQADQDQASGATTDVLADDDPNKSW